MQAVNLERQALGDDAAASGLRWDGRTLHLLDQTELPARERWLRCESVEDVARAIERLAVRGAPAIAAAAAYGLVLGIDEDSGGKWGPLGERVEAAASRLAVTRPTAVNLAWAIASGRSVLRAAAAAGEQAAERALRDWADGVVAEETASDDALIGNSVGLFGTCCRALTHCNTGRLATASRGTAMGAIEAAFLGGRLAHVWVTETRPLLQGARLTTWELGRAGVPHTLITDGSVGEVMRQGLVDVVIVGADRVAANGDVANKIGTYAIAVVARHHNIPFYVAAPHSTLDPSTATGSEIPLEQRAASEVTTFGGSSVAPDGTPVLNLAFDVTPAELIDGIVTDRGLLRPPYAESVSAAARLPATTPAGASPGLSVA
jgi:methylthioribose-1-phosphate isomerase